MNKIVREHYPVEKLPEDLRALLDPTKSVTLVIEQEDAEPAAGSLTAVLDEMQDRRVSSNDPAKRIRALRSKWDTREEFIKRIRTGNDD